MKSNALNDHLQDGDDVSIEMEDDMKSTTDESGSRDAKSNSQPALAQRETKAVGYSKLLVIFFFFCVATVAAIGTFRYTRSEEEKDFEVRVC